jgi:hypothetical protein
MSNNYIVWAETLQFPTPEIANWANDFFTCLNNIANDETMDNPSIPNDRPEFRNYLENISTYSLDCGGFGFAFEEPGMDANSILVCSDENGNLEALLEAIQVVLKHFNLDLVFTLQWAEYGDRNRIGEAGGGAAVVTRTVNKAVHTSTLRDQLVAELSK